MNTKSILATLAVVAAAPLAFAQITIATGVDGISGNATLNVDDNNWSVFYRPNSGEGVLSGPNAEWRQSIFTPSFVSGLLDVQGMGLEAISARAVVQAGSGAWIDPRLVSTFENEARWISPYSANTVAGTLLSDGTLITGYEPANGDTTLTNRVGDYFYTYTFELTASTIGDMSIKWATDNRSSVYINGTFVAAKGLPAISTITAATIAESELVIGVNEILVVVRNENVGIVSGDPSPSADANPTGLVFYAIPEPSTAGILVAFAAIGFAILRRRR